MKNVDLKELMIAWKVAIVDLFIVIWECIKYIAKYWWIFTVKIFKFIWSLILKLNSKINWSCVGPYVAIIAIIFIVGFVIAIVSHSKTIDKLLTNVAMVNTLTEKVDSLSYANYVDEELLTLDKLFSKYRCTPKYYSMKMTPENVAEIANEVGIWYPDIMMAQIEKETTWGVADVFKKSNNPLCIVYFEHDPFYHIYGKKFQGYSCYDNWPISIIDYQRYMFAHFDRKPTRDEFVIGLNNFYAKSKTYGNHAELLSHKYLQYLK